MSSLTTVKAALAGARESQGLEAYEYAMRIHLLSEPSNLPIFSHKLNWLRLTEIGEVTLAKDAQDA